MAKAVRFDKDTYRIVEGEKIVAFAMALSNGGWCLTDIEANRMGRTIFDKPKDAAAAWNAMQAAA